MQRLRSAFMFQSDKRLCCDHFGQPIVQAFSLCGLQILVRAYRCPDWFVSGYTCLKAHFLTLYIFMLTKKKKKKKRKETEKGIKKIAKSCWVSHVEGHIVCPFLLKKNVQVKTIMLFPTVQKCLVLNCHNQWHRKHDQHSEQTWLLQAEDLSDTRHT